MRSIVLIVVGLLIGVGAGGYWFYMRGTGPKPVPVAVVEAENALALPEVVGLMHFNVDHAVGIERTLLGEEDRQALLAPISNSDSIGGILIRGGVNLRESVDHFVGAAFIMETGLATVGIALGNFPVARVAELLSEIYQVEEAVIAGIPVLMLTKADPVTCQVSAPLAVHLSSQRIVMGDPALVGPVLERLDAKARSAISLEDWRAYRQGKILSLALLTSPKDLAEAIPLPMVRMSAEAADDKLEVIEKVYAGVSFEALPPSLEIETRVETNDPAWAPDTVRAYESWITDVDADIRRELPALARLQEHLSIESDGPHLIARASISKDFLRDAAEIPVELLKLAFSGFGAVASSGNPTDTSEEQTVPPEELTTYRASLSHRQLPQFDPELDQNFKTLAQTGPFGIRIKAFRLTEAEDQVVEIELEVASGELHNMDVDSMHQVNGDARAQLFITGVLDSDGQDLLRPEPCGADRNSVGGELRPVSKFLYIDNEFVQVPAVSGSKAVRLKPGKGVRDVASIVGHVRLRLPTTTKTHRIQAPFGGQVIQTPIVRIRVNQSEPGSVKYEISGQADNVLATRALNASGEYLRASESYGFNRFLGVGKTIDKSFQGRPAIAEFVVATAEVVERYSFEISPAAPGFGRWDHPKPFTVSATNADEFRASAAKTDLSGACEDRPEDSQVKPLQLCPLSAQVGWSGVQSQFRVLAPKLPGLAGNLSALEIRLASMAVQESPGASEQRIPSVSSAYLQLRTSFGTDALEDTVWLSSDAPEEIKDKAIVAVQGTLVARLPEKLAKMTLDVTELGNRAEDESGLTARLVGIENGSLQLDVTGPREKIVQFVPLDAEGVVLATSGVRLDRLDESDRWRGTLMVSGRPATLDIVFAEVQERLEYAFDMAVGE